MIVAYVLVLCFGLFSRSGYLVVGIGYAACCVLSVDWFYHLVICFVDLVLFSWFACCVLMDFGCFVVCFGWVDLGVVDCFLFVC